MVKIITLLKNEIYSHKIISEEIQLCNDLNKLDNTVKNTTQKLLMDYSRSLFVVPNQDYKLILN